MLRASSLVQNYDWVWQQRGCVISSHFQQISLITGYVLGFILKLQPNKKLKFTMEYDGDEDGDLCFVKKN